MPDMPRDPNRCAVCGWPLAETRDKGCVRGNCSMRPLPERFYDPVRAGMEYRRNVLMLATKHRFLEPYPVAKPVVVTSEPVADPDFSRGFPA